jgi:microcystin-dependent protein
MPRDSSGAYSLPSGTLVNTGDTILVSQHNPAMQDIEQSMSNSLDRDGKGGMRDDLNMGGNKATNLAPGVADTDAATVGQLGDTVTIPIGTIFDYAGATPPTGYLLCYGQAVSRTTYAALFVVLGTAFGTGDGATTFNLPDCRGRTGAGKDDMGGTAASRLTTAGSGVNGASLGAAGGAQTHTLTTAEIPSHSHSVTDPGHHHGGVSQALSERVAIGITADGFNDILGSTENATTGITIANTGGGTAHSIVQPTIILNKIMRVL